MKEGTISFWLRHPHVDWTTNSVGYNFGVTKHSGITIEVIKHPDKTLEVTIDSTIANRFHFRGPIPKANHREVSVIITWSQSKEVNLYLNGILVKNKSA